MTDGLLRRELAPLTEKAWKAIGDEARETLAVGLAGRQLVDFDGPHGWTHAGVNTGRLRVIDPPPAEGVHVGLREVAPVIEVRVPFELSQMEVDGINRGASDADLGPVAEAADKLASFEDGVIFDGAADLGVEGVLATSPHKPVRIGSANKYPQAIAEAQEALLGAGVDGPLALALGPDCFKEVSQAEQDGYPIRKRLERQLDGGRIVRAPSLDGGALVSTRGGDYLLSVGQDIAIGYASHDRDDVELYLTESFTVRVIENAAAVRLRR